MQVEQTDQLKPEDMIDEFGVADAPMDAELVVSMINDLKSLLEPSAEPSSGLTAASQL